MEERVIDQSSEDYGNGVGQPKKSLLMELVAFHLLVFGFCEKSKEILEDRVDSLHGWTFLGCHGDDDSRTNFYTLSAPAICSPIALWLVREIFPNSWPGLKRMIDGVWVVRMHGMDSTSEHEYRDGAHSALVFWENVRAMAE